ncbi:MAG: DUF5652 family protein [Rikenellaceae bacterium]|nr:DUF5652 family protein [Rikenellaceae bacterium]
MAWFICLAVFNTVGLLPIVYLLLEKGKRNNPGLFFKKLRAATNFRCSTILKYNAI